MAPISDYWPGVLAFVRVVEVGSFTGAARSLHMTPSAISKAVARLERRLGARLLQRSTRTLSLTQKGTAFYERVSPAVRSLRDADESVSAAALPRGLLRVTVPIDLGRTLIACWMGDFAGRYPGLRLELNITDRFVDLWREGYDVAIRMGTLAQSSLATRELGSIDYAVVASPEYITARGKPETVEHLRTHAGLRYVTTTGQPMPWVFEGEGFMPEGPFDSDDGGALRMAAVKGAGIAYLLRFAVEDDLADGKLVELLPDIEKPALKVYALHAYRDMVPTRVRAFLKFVASRLAK